MAMTRPQNPLPLSMPPRFTTQEAEDIWNQGADSIFGPSPRTPVLTPTMTPVVARTQPLEGDYSLNFWDQAAPLVPVENVFKDDSMTNDDEDEEDDEEYDDGADDSTGSTLGALAKRRRCESFSSLIKSDMEEVLTAKAECTPRAAEAKRVNIRTKRTTRRRVATRKAAEAAAAAEAGASNRKRGRTRGSKCKTNRTSRAKPTKSATVSPSTTTVATSRTTASSGSTATVAGGNSRVATKKKDTVPKTSKTAGAADAGSDNQADDESALSLKKKREERLRRNRESANRSRQRKKLEMQGLRKAVGQLRETLAERDARIATLQEQNVRLRAQLLALQSMTGTNGTISPSSVTQGLASKPDNTTTKVMVVAREV